jgi:hypothetical protein
VTPQPVAVHDRTAVFEPVVAPGGALDWVPKGVSEGGSDWVPKGVSEGGSVWVPKVKFAGASQSRW